MLQSILEKKRGDFARAFFEKTKAKLQRKHR